MLKKEKSLPRRQAGAFGGKKLKSFTLVELLVVIVIIGILAGLIVFAMRSSISKAKDARAKDGVKSVQTVLDLLALDYPGGLPERFSSGLQVINVPLKDINNQILLSSVPTGANDAPLKINVIDKDNYEVWATSAENGMCWYYTPTKNNLSASKSEQPCPDGV